MRQIDVKAFKVIVKNQSSGATILCVTYKLGQIGQHYGADFYVLASNFDNSGVQVPNPPHALTFREELLIFHTAAEITPINREGINAWLELKMQETYGSGSTSTVEALSE